MKTRVTFIVRRLGRGGAERQLLELLKRMEKETFEINLICLYSGGGLWEESLAIPAVTIQQLGKTGRWNVSVIPRLYKLLRKSRPDIVHGYLGVPNLLALVGGRLIGAKVVWGVRASNLDLRQYDYLSRAVARVEGWCARFADLIICNSEAGRMHAVSRGFPPARTKVIQNGIDTDKFRPDREGRARLRQEWGIQPSHYLIGVIARLDPVKGHEIFLAAAAMIVSELESVRFALVGGGPEEFRRQLQSKSADSGLRDKLIWAGERSDIPAVMSSLDLMVSASLSEGFSNVVAECMACGVQCIATDVGDSRAIMGEFGAVVPPGEPVALADAIRAMIHSGKPDVGAGELMRRRMQAEFSAARLADRTGLMLRTLVGEGAELSSYRGIKASQ